jgi:flagellar basal-body rod protein FlgF
MAYDISTVAAAMDQKIMQLEYISSNLANASTPGFKAQHLLLLNPLGDDAREGNMSSSLTSIVVDFNQGIPLKTSNPLDVHLQGDGFFVVETREGEAYTRKGDFTINGSNQMVTQTGDPVLGEAGPITLTNGKVHIAADGSVFADQTQVGKMKIVDFTNRQALLKAGNGLFRDEGAAGVKKVDNPILSSGAIELSNVNAITEMAEMINIHRTFETYQKVIWTLNEQDKLAVSRIGKV